MMAVEAVKEKFYCFLGIVHPTRSNAIFPFIKPPLRQLLIAGPPPVQPDRSQRMWHTPHHSVQGLPANIALPLKHHKGRSKLSRLPLKDHNI